MKSKIQKIYLTITSAAVFFLGKIGVASASASIILGGDIPVPVELEAPSFLEKSLELGRMFWGGIALVLLLVILLVIKIIRRRK
jgi:hypothetical protein